MSGKPVILDTNIVVAHFRTSGKHDEALRKHQTYLPQVVVAELYAGAFRSQRPDYHQQVIEKFLDSVIILSSSLETTKLYGALWAGLADQGNMIPHNDIWIAALALQYGMPLVSNDAHFKNIEGLILECW